MKKVVIRSFNIITNWLKGVLEVKLKFMFSKRLNLVSNCIPFGLLQRKTLFSEGRINFKMLPLKLVRLFTITNVQIQIIPF